MGISIDVAKTAANSHWATIANRVIGISDDYLSKKHGPCPKCGGETRFRIFDDFEQTGGMVCSHCGKFGDGFSAAQWFLNVPFFEAIEKICSFLGVVDDKPKKTKTKSKKKEPQQEKAKLVGAHPENSEGSGYDIESRKEKQELEFIDWKSKLFSQWACTKKPITEEGVKLAGGRFARYRGMTVIAIPIIGRDGKPNGHAIYNATGGTIPYRPRGSKEFEQLKVKLVGVGNASGWIGRFLPGVETIKAEGVSDTLALLSANQSGSVICNPFGAGEDPLAKHRQWMLEQLRNQVVFTIHDCDQPGADGASWVSNGNRSRPGWSPAIAIVAKESRNVRLPFEIEEKHGKDSRDYLNEQIESGKSIEEAFEALMLIARASEVIEKPEGYVVEVTEEEPASGELNESEDDPHRLARVNLEHYEIEHGGKVKYWRNEWWKYKDGCWRKIEDDDFRSKLTASIRNEFERCWRLRQEKGGDDSSQPIHKVTQSLVSNVIGATKGTDPLTYNLEMPVWLPDRSRRNYLSMKNGLLDLDAIFAKKGMDECLLPHSSHWFSPFQLNYDFDPNAECPNFDAYLDFICDGDEEKHNLMQEWAGYLLWPHSLEQKFFVFEGDGGTGKSTFFSAMTAMLGDDNVSSLSLEDFAGAFNLQTVVGKAANISGDVGQIQGPEETILKRYTGVDKLTFQRKHKSEINVRPTAKLMMAWNDRPKFRDKTDGLWRRMILVPLNRKIPAGQKNKQMVDYRFWFKEASGIMRWALVGLARLLEQQGFSDCKSTNEALGDYRTDVNPILEFFGDYVQQVDDSIGVDLLYKLYKEWAEESGHRPLNVRSFGKQVVLQLKAEKIRPRIGKGRFSAYGRIGLTGFGLEKSQREGF